MPIVTKNLAESVNKYKTISKSNGCNVVILFSPLPENAQDLVQVSPDLERLIRSMTPQEIKDGQTLVFQFFVGFHDFLFQAGLVVCKLGG